MPSVSDVLHVYSGNLFGGVERMLISLATLPVPHHRAHFALCFDGKLSQALQSERATVTLLGPVRLRRPMSAFRARKALKRLLAARNFDAVVCHSIWTYCIFAPVIARAGKVSILYLHDIPNPNGAYYKWAWRNPPDLCIANSATTSEPLAQMGSKVPVRIVHPLVMPPQPVDLKAVEALRHQFGAAPEEVVILLASRFEQLKGHKNLIEALHHLSENTTWRCWIAGAPQRPEEETYKQGLAQMIESCRISQRVSFIGHRDDMETVLAACDIYCQPNETAEAFGMVFVEALYAGRPVVGRDIGGAREIVTTECGILCSAGVHELSNALSRLLTDVKLRQQMSDAGPARARELSAPESFQRGFNSALESALSQ